MSEHYISKEKKCWSCSYYVGNRKTEKGFLGFKVKCDSKGKCSNNRSFYKDKEVAEWVKCDRYEMWGVIESELAREADEKARRKEEKEAAKQEQLAEQERLERERAERYRRIEAERQEQENQAELKRQRRAIEEERQKLAEERKKLEYEKWYMTLSDDEKKAEDERVARENEEKLIKQQQEQEAARIRAHQLAEEQKRQAEIEKQQRFEENQRQAARRRAEEAKRKKRNKIILFSAIGISAFIIALIIIIVSISVSNSPKKKINEYLSAYNNSKYTQTINVPNWDANFSIQSKMNGEYFDVDVVYNIKNTFGGFDTAHTWIAFTYGEKSDFTKERTIIVSSGSNKASVIISFELKNNPYIKMTSYKIDYQQGNLNLTGSSFYYCEDLIEAMFGYTDEFLKKVNPSYSLW